MLNLTVHVISSNRIFILSAIICLTYTGISVQRGVLSLIVDWDFKKNQDT